MAASVGAVTFDHVKGFVRSKNESLDSFTRPGYDGHGSIVIGKRGDESPLTCIKYVESASLATHIAAVEALQGTVVTVEDDFGRQSTACEVLDVRPGSGGRGQSAEPRQKVWKAQSGSVVERVRTEFMIVVRKT